MLLPGACVVTFGHMLHDKRKEKKAEKVAMNAQVLPGTAQKKVIFGRQGAVVFGAMAIIFLIGLTFTGVLLVGSAEPALRNKQFFGMMLGVAIMLIVSLMDFSWILNFYWILYGCNIILLLSVWIFGTESNGASRWLRIGGF